MVRVVDRVEDIFHSYAGPSGGIDMKAVFRLLWSTMGNSVSLVDVAGVFAVSIPTNSNNSEVLSQEIFQDFFRAFSRLKYPMGSDFCEKMLDEIRHIKGSKPHLDTGILSAVADKNVIRVFLKYDLPLRRAFSTFCGQAMRVGAVVSWDEVKVLSLGMELDGFISFAGSYALIPQLLSTQQCEILFREVMSKYSLSANSSTLSTSMLFPQFQLLLAMVAQERHDMRLRKGGNDLALSNKQVFAKKPIDGQAKHLSDMLTDLFRDMGISKFDETNLSYSTQYVGIAPGTSSMSAEQQYDNGQHPTMTLPPINQPQTTSSTSVKNLFTGSVTQPAVNKPQDMYSSNVSHSRQAMLLRMEHLFDEVEGKLLQDIAPGAPVLLLLNAPPDDLVESKARLPTKPVVISDALPVPGHCPETVEQLLEASLAHHNLGSFEEALKFLEAARIQLEDIVHSMTGYTHEHHILQTHKAQQQTANGYQTTTILPEQPPFFDVLMYILLCKGNVYQSCGDDEQSLLQYLDAWNKAHTLCDRDWEIVCVNAAGILAFFSLRYEVALLSFRMVLEYREGAYGNESADTATALNNEACALYCLSKRGEARIRFERAWNAMTKTIGHRAPRCITVWKNLEKARRSHAPLQNKKDMKDSVAMRPDVDRLILGGAFTIMALPPPEIKKKKGKGGGKKKKK